MGSEKPWYLSKAIWLGILTTIASVLALIAGEEWVQQWPAIVGVMGTIVGVLTVVIRLLTGVPIRRSPTTRR